MATANLPWSFGTLSGYAPLISCTFTILVTRDGTPLPSFTVTTDLSGNAAGVYVDPTASPTLTHLYVFTPQTSGCAASALLPAFSVNWNCAGDAPPIDPPGDPGTGGTCPLTADSFAVCGETAGPEAISTGVSYTKVQNFLNSTSVVVTCTVPGLTTSVTATSGTATGTPTTNGTYSITFRGKRAGCPDCVVTYPIVVGVAACGTQTWEVVKGGSAFDPASATEFNSALQVIRVTLVGPPGKTFRFVATGTVTVTGPIQTIPGPGPGPGTYTTDFVVGQASGYNTNWKLEGAGADPVTLCNPGTTNIRGDTCVTLAVTQNALDYTIVVDSNTVPLPEDMAFSLDFAGTGFGGTLPGVGCVGATYAGPAAGPFDFSLDGSIPLGKFTYGPTPVTAPYDVAIRLNLLDAEHQICGPACARVTF